MRYHCDVAAQEQGPRKVSQTLLMVVSLLLTNPTKADWYSLGVVRETGLGSGTVTQILFRMEQWGWIEARWEDTAEARAEGRPPRRFYRLTGMGEQAANNLIDLNQQRLRRWLPRRV